LKCKGKSITRYSQQLFVLVEKWKFGSFESDPVQREYLMLVLVKFSLYSRVFLDRKLVMMGILSSVKGSLDERHVSTSVWCLYAMFTHLLSWYKCKQYKLCLFYWFLLLLLLWLIIKSLSAVPGPLWLYVVEHTRLKFM